MSLTKTGFLCTMLMAVMVMASLSEAQAQTWEHFGTEDGVRLSRMQVKGSDVVAFRGEIVADIHIGKIIEVFIDEKARKHWVDRYHSHRTLDKGKRSERYWIKFGLPFPVSNRDYVLHTDVKIDEGKRIFIANIKSVVDPRAPENKCCVRAETFGTFYHFEAIKGSEKTRMIVEVHTDPKGMLPTWLVNRIQKDWPSKTLGGLLKYASRKGQKTHPEMLDWHK